VDRSPGYGRVPVGGHGVTVSEAATVAVVILLVSLYAAYRVQKWLRRFARRHRGAIGFITGLFAGRSLQRRRPQPLQGDDMWAACELSKWGRGYRDLLACRWCNEPLRGATGFCGQQCRDVARGNHYFNEARKLRRWADGHRCTGCGKSGTGVTIEIDHIERAWGRHNVPSCIHHQDNLQSLCGGGGKSCHQKRTNRQRRGAA
jgi:hypothetical protein